MIEPKISLSLLVPGATMLSSQECEKNPKKNYDENKLPIQYSKGKGKNQKIVKQLLVYNTRKQRLVTQIINMGMEAYKYMLSTPTSPKFAKPIKVNKYGDVILRVWDTISEQERLKKHFDLIAHDLNAVSYSSVVFND